MLNAGTLAPANVRSALASLTSSPFNLMQRLHLCFDFFTANEAIPGRHPGRPRPSGSVAFAGLDTKAVTPLIHCMCHRCLVLLARSQKADRMRSRRCS